MRDKKYQILAIAITLFVLYGAYYATRSETEKLESGMLSAFEDHDHEEALLYASQLLGLQPDHSGAKQVIRDSSQIFSHLDDARSALSEFWTLKDGAVVEPERLYQGLQNSREHLAKAKSLDPKFETTLEFEEKLDEAQSQLIYIFAFHVKEIGEGTVSKASENYRKASAIIDSAASSQYLSKFLRVQSAWATNAKQNDSGTEELGRELEKMDEMGGLVSDYEGKNARTLVKALQAYMATVRETIDAVRSPKGNYNDYVKLVTRGNDTFQKARERLESRIPSTFLAKNNYSRLLEDISEYKFFEHESITEIMAQSQTL
ncbi:MAG: hypothetical protein ACU843_00015 [Gammaproteobacteria bacterium]